MDFELLYAQLPIFLQNATVSAQGFKINRWRYGGNYDHVLADCVRRLDLDADALRAYQTSRLAMLFRSAAETPFWKQRFREYGIDANGSDPFVEIQKLPILTKGEIKAHVAQITNRSFPPRELIARHTSGTTGSGLVFTGTRLSEQETWAVWWRYRLLHGIARDSWCGYFGGRSVVPAKQTEPPFWRTNYPGRQVMFSAYHLNQETAVSYLDCLRRRKVSWLHGYPSVLSLLASFVVDRSLEPIRSVRIVTTGAESLSEAQRSQIQRAFRAKVAEHYGQAEAVANISQCEAGSLHVDEDFSLVEFEPVGTEPGRYRIIGTNWVNPAFPLFRYDTGDVATLNEHATCACGRIGRIVSQIDGRIEDYLVLPNGSKIGRLDHIFKDCINVREAQIYQGRDGKITFRIVKGDNYSTADHRQLEGEIRKRLGADVDFDMEYCAEITKTGSGKLRFVVSDFLNKQ